MMWKLTVSVLQVHLSCLWALQFCSATGFASWQTAPRPTQALLLVIRLFITGVLKYMSSGGIHVDAWFERRA